MLQLGAAAALLHALAGELDAQWRGAGGAQATVAYTALDPAPGGAALDEARVVHVVGLGHVQSADGWLRVEGMINLEGLTAPGGELAPGVFGEGFVDRRHPHTYLHELMVTVSPPASGRLAGSLAAGKGFAPFGTDDPMSRPVMRYPVNHHFAQLLERAVLIVAAGYGPVAAEAAIFNGDEPDEPAAWPNLARFGDSWSARVTVRPAARLEAQVSQAVVQSPEHRAGAGSEQRKWSASLRGVMPLGRGELYGLAEWARTTEADGFFEFQSALAEGAWSRGRHRLHYRFERTERPEEERLADPFRSVRPHHDDSNLGTTRWTVHTAGYTLRVPLPAGGPRVSGLAEVSRARVIRLSGVFEPERFYGDETLWSVSLGLRVALGAPMHRMGRYGAATAPEAIHEPHTR